ncbi:WYL domain-containing protein [Patescibacteria group bacterium]|nr:WYL domain-containing protein [Patescibacteria group bacterium]
MIWKKAMYQLLAWQTLKKVFGLSSKWSEGENEAIKKLKQEVQKRLSTEQLNFVNRRSRQLRNDYHESLVHDLEKIYWHELHEDEEFLIPLVEYDEKTYSVWTQAVRRKKSVVMTYDSTTSGITQRTVDPYLTKAPYGKGYCHLKKEVRKFRFDRIVEISLTDKTFVKPKDWREL